MLRRDRTNVPETRKDNPEVFRAVEVTVRRRPQGGGARAVLPSQDSSLDAPGSPVLAVDHVQELVLCGLLLFIILSERLLDLILRWLLVAPNQLPGDHAGKGVALDRHDPGLRLHPVHVEDHAVLPLGQEPDVVAGLEVRPQLLPEPGRDLYHLAPDSVDAGVEQDDAYLVLHLGPEVFNQAQLLQVRRDHDQALAADVLQLLLELARDANLRGEGAHTSRLLREGYDFAFLGGELPLFPRCCCQALCAERYAQAVSDRLEHLHKDARKLAVAAHHLLLLRRLEDILHQEALLLLSLDTQTEGRRQLHVQVADTGVQRVLRALLQLVYHRRHVAGDLHIVVIVLAEDAVKDPPEVEGPAPRRRARTRGPQPPQGEAARP
mmetsp:Transcript_52009/g.137385  ORF Transcript_52009/g.137385 Transcript_52009/m.137385 type:complete len:379 (-) Transcript_52009:253-1389(-)